MFLEKGLARSGTASTRAASKAKQRKKELFFMRVKFLSERIESAAIGRRAGEMELTRKRRTSSLAGEDTSSSWTNGRKSCVSRPRGCHRGGFFLNLALSSALWRLPPYRRNR